MVVYFSNVVAMETVAMCVCYVLNKLDTFDQAEEASSSTSTWWPSSTSWFQMCRGDNTKVIQTLQGAPATQTIGIEIDFDLIMNAIEDQMIKTSLPRLRASFVELLKGT